MLLSIHLNRISGIPDNDKAACFKDAFHIGQEDYDPSTRMHDPSTTMAEVKNLLKCLKLKKADVEDYKKSIMVISGEFIDILYAVTVRTFELWPEIKESQDPSVLYEDDIFKQIKKTYEALVKKLLSVFPEMLLGKAWGDQLQNEKLIDEDSLNLIVSGNRWLLSNIFEGLIGIIFNVDSFKFKCK